MKSVAWSIKFIYDLIQIMRYEVGDMICGIIITKTTSFLMLMV